MADLINRDQHEASFARRMGRLSTKHRKQLEGLLGTPPDAANVPPEFWQRVQRETEEELMLMLFLIFALSAEQHGMGRDRAREFGRDYAQRTAPRLAGLFTQHSRELTRGFADGEPMKRIDTKRHTLKVFGPSRVEHTVVTEITKATSEGGEVAVEQTVGLDEEDTWFTENDARVCPICRPLHDKKRSEWTRFFPSGPPAHVHCRCWIHYANEKRGARVLART